MVQSICVDRCSRPTPFVDLIENGCRRSGVILAMLSFVCSVQAQESMLGVVAPTAAEAERVVSWDDPLGGSRLILSLGVRRDDFNWHIADADGSPNILSELTWKKMTITQLHLSSESKVGQVVLIGDLSLGVIHDGRTQDSDYFGNNRTGEFSRSYSDSDGDVFDGSIGLGVPFLFFYPKADGVAMLTPMVGLAANYQNLEMKNGVQIIPPDGAFPEPLNSTYDASWKGPWIGVMGDFYNAKRLLARIQWEYHFAVKYKAVADWNLRDDFKHPESFRHRADAQGHRLLLSVRYLTLARTELYFALDGHWYFTDNGTDITYFSDGATSRLQLNRAEWDSVAVNVGVVSRF